MGVGLRSIRLIVGGGEVMLWGGWVTGKGLNKRAVIVGFTLFVKVSMSWRRRSARG